MGFTWTVKGDWSKTTRMLEKARSGQLATDLNRFAEAGRASLVNATPRESGATANAWGYKIVHKGKNSFEIVWTNSSEKNGVPIVMLIQYGHGQHQGGYVMGRDFINPAMRPVFDKIASDIWRKVSNL